MVAEPEFIHLRVHSSYSILEGAIKMKALAKKMAADGIPAVGVTDTNNLFGAMDFAIECSKVGVQPVLGCQLLIESPKREVNAFAEDKPTYDKMVVMVQNEQGYQNLLLHFRAFYMGEGKENTIPHLTFDELLTHTEGLLLFTGGAEGLLGRPILDGHPEFAEELLQKMLNAFPGRVYMELQRHGLETEEKTEPRFIEWAYKYNVPFVATNDAYFLTPDMYEAHDALICIAQKTYVDEMNRRRVTPEHYLKSPEEMKALFADIPEAIQNTVQIAKRCFFLAGKKKPAFPNFDCQGLTEDEMLAKMAEEGFEKRMVGRTEEERKAYHDRLEYELGIIKTMGFPGYFLIVADFIQWSKANGVPVGPGRGSGAGSVVAWCLTITNIDPLRFNLLFERFLNPERVSMPDFDVDFCQENRYKTIEYVQNKYGADHVAQILALGQLQAKAVIRDVGRVLQLPYPVVDRLSKLVPNELGISLQDALDKEPEFGKEMAADENIKRLIEIALQLEGMYRNISMHAAGVVIGNKPLEQIVPLYKDPSSDMPITQYDKHFVEDASLIKFDFLGLKTLTTIAKTMELLKPRGITIDENDLPLEDEKTYELLKSGNTTGVFQLESTGMRKILHDMQPDKIEDIVALVSLYRPGPMDSIPSYIARKKGEETPDYMHPMLEGILKETYGIMIYQEQVMQISQVMAGYTLGGADLLRRAMGKKIKEEMDKQRSIFVEGAVKNKVKRDVAEHVFDKMAKFAEYGFNKSHAAAYAYIAYQTAYLKAHFPVEFMAATMTLDKTNTEKLEFFKNDLHQMGIDVLPPDINKSGVNFTVENGAVRYALSAIKNVGEAGMAQIVAEREAHGPFKSVRDFFDRVDASALNKRYVENLIKSGAFDCVERNRAKIFESIESLLGHAVNATQSRKSAQISLFGGSDVNANSLKIKDIPDWPNLERLSKEAEALGFYLSAHPLDSFGSVFERLRVVSSDEVAKMVQTSGAVRVQMAGIVSNVRERISQKGNKFAFVAATDKAGAFECMCFSDVLAINKEKLKSGQPLLLTISADKRPDDDSMRMSLQSVEYLSEVMSHTATTLIITLYNENGIPEMKRLLETDGKGKSKVYFIVKANGYTVETVLPGTYALRPETVDGLQRCAGIESFKQV